MGYLKKYNIHLANISAVATDGAPDDLLLDSRKSFPMHDSLCLKKTTSKSQRIQCAFEVCIKSINRIKAHPLNSRLFTMFGEDMRKNDETLN